MIITDLVGRPRLRSTTMHPSLQKRLLRRIGFTLLPLFCLTCLLTCSVVSPIGLGFLTSFEIVNATDEDLIVTPIGARGKEGKRGTLPLFTSSRFYITSSQSGEFALPAGSSISLTYDWDDVQFSEIVCRRPDGSHVIVPTGLHPTRGQYQPPPSEKFEITDLNALQPAADLHLRGVSSTRPGRILTIHVLAGLGLLSPFCFWIAHRIRCAEGSEPEDNPARGRSDVG